MRPPIPVAAPGKGDIAVGKLCVSAVCVGHKFNIFSLYRILNIY